jgi:hypothetical protein
VSIWASTFAIEDERQWVAELEADGIKAGVIRDGQPAFDDLDAPIIYQGSHVLPEMEHARGGSLDLAVVLPHVRFWRENPDAEVSDEPYGEPTDPFLRLSLHEHADTPHRSEGDATVILTLRQAQRLRDELAEFCGYFESNRMQVRS